MKYRLKFFRGEVFASPYIYLPMVNPIGCMFSLDGKVYKIIDAIFSALNEPVNHKEVDDSLPVLTVVEIPFI